MSTRTPSSSSSRLMLTIGLCFLVALMEGLDLQAAGIAAGGIAQAFALDKMQMGWIFSAGILGLLPGALVGGMLADRYGRKRILISSVALFGLFSLATAIAWDFPSLVFARLMTGVGLGAALPNLIALTSEAAGPRFRGTAVSLMYCGVPIGAALAATLGFAGANLAWQTVFWVGGVVPLILVPLLMRWLPESAVFAGEKQAAPPLRALFAPETATATLLLWLCYFFTLLVVYMLINWLPLLLVEQGFQPSQAAGVMFALQMGAASEVCGGPAQDHQRKDPQAHPACPITPTTTRQEEWNMADQPKHRNTREALIQAGINEINEYGVANLSMRRIAKACGVSPGAPYKHFSDRNDFIAAIIEAVNLQWRDSQLQLLETYAGDSAKQIVEMSTGYVRFLIENPHLAAILTLKDEEFDNVYHRLRGELSSPTQKLILQYCQEHDIDRTTRRRRVYVIRALIFGAIIQFDSGELIYSEETLQMVHDCIAKALVEA